MSKRTKQTKRNETNETKRNETKRNAMNEMKKTKRNETKEGFLVVRMALPNTFLKVFLPSEWPYRTHFRMFFCRSNDAAEHIFECFFAVRMALPNTFFNGF